MPEKNITTHKIIASNFIYKLVRVDFPVSKPVNPLSKRTHNYKVVSLAYKKNICYSPSSQKMDVIRKIVISNLLAKVGSMAYIRLIEKLKLELEKNHVTYPRVPEFSRVQSWEDFYYIMHRILEHKSLYPLGISLLLQFKPPETRY